jgi:hypothetical protein
MVKPPSDRKDREKWAKILLNSRGAGGIVAYNAMFVCLFVWWGE